MVVRSAVAVRCTMLAGAVAIAACGDSAQPQRGANGDALANPYAGYASATYGGTANWLCHPELAGPANACNGNLDATSVAADGGAQPIPFAAPADPPADCFYVYPTTSPDPTINSDRIPDAQEIQTTLMQAGRYGEVCRVFAPVYRQRTLIYLALDTAIDGAVTDEQILAANEIAYGDVADAFREYVANHNGGRGFFILGHSQGARISARLIAEEVEQHAYLSQRLIASHIPGYSVAAPAGADVGGALATTPACRSTAQTGCVVAYSSYRRGDPQLSEPRFGVTGDPATRALCVNPASPGGGPGIVEPYLPFVLPPVFQALLIPRGSTGPYANPVMNATLALQAPFFNVPGQIEAECVEDAAGTSYLEIRIAADPADPRADDYPGEFLGGTGWGLHLADVNLAQRTLVEMARAQSAAWRASRP